MNVARGKHAVLQANPCRQTRLFSSRNTAVAHAATADSGGGGGGGGRDAGNNVVAPVPVAPGDDGGPDRRRAHDDAPQDTPEEDSGLCTHRRESQKFAPRREMRTRTV